MDNKQNQQNQPNPGASSSSSNAADKSASQSAASASNASGANAAGGQSGSNSGTSGRQSQQPASAATSASSRQPQPEAQDKNSDTAASATSATDANASESKSGQQQDSPRKSWLDQEQWAKSVDQLPQSLKDFGSKAMEQVNSLSTTQKVVGGALLVSGLSWLAMRGKGGKSSSADTSRYTPKGESKWKSSSESVYRGTTSSLRDDANDTSF